MSFFNLFIYFIVIANIYFFQIDRLEPSFTDSVFVSVSVSMIPFPFPDPGFHVLVLPVFNLVDCVLEDYVRFIFSYAYKRKLTLILPAQANFSG